MNAVEVSPKEFQEFIDTFPIVVRDILTCPLFQDVPSHHKEGWMTRLLEYNVPKGKLTRARSIILARKCWPDADTADNKFLTYILAWCIELLNTFYLIADDLMDGDQWRRGAPCWYLLEDVGAAAYTDGLFLQYSVFILLKKYFKGNKCYVELMELFHDCTVKSSSGQSLDMCGTRTLDSALYNTATFEAIAFYKTACYSYLLPVSLVMSMVDAKVDPTERNVMRTILRNIGIFLQLANDYFDIFGTIKFTGKTGITDIFEGKVAWPVVAALEVANPTQRELILGNYGKKDPEKVAFCKELFTEIGLPDMHLKKEQEIYAETEALISKISNFKLQKLFRFMLYAVPNRKKFQELVKASK